MEERYKKRKGKDEWKRRDGCNRDDRRLSGREGRQRRWLQQLRDTENGWKKGRKKEERE